MKTNWIIRETTVKQSDFPEASWGPWEIMDDGMRYSFADSREDALVALEMLKNEAQDDFNAIAEQYGEAQRRLGGLKRALRNEEA